MASTYSATKAGTGVQPRAGIGINQQVESYAITGALVVNDVVRLFKIPKGAKVIDAGIAVDDLDQGAGLKLDVGDSNDQDRFIVQSTVGQAGGVARLAAQAGVDYEYTADDYFQVKVQTAPASAQTTGTIRGWLLYSMAQ